MLARGFSLVEQLISLAIGSLLISAAVTAISTLTSRVLTVNTTLSLQEELITLSHLLKQEIERSGYINASPEHIATSPLLPWTVAQFGQEQMNSCLLYSYDKNQNGVIDSASPNELFGIRLRDRALEYRYESKQCDETGWHDLTSTEHVLITRFSISAPSLYPSLVLIEIEVTAPNNQNVVLRTTFYAKRVNISET